MSVIVIMVFFARLGGLGGEACVPARLEDFQPLGRCHPLADRTGLPHVQAGVVDYDSPRGNARTSPIGIISITKALEEQIMSPVSIEVANMDDAGAWPVDNQPDIGGLLLPPCSQSGNFAERERRRRRLPRWSR
jgi:hypothetical protein